MATTEVTPAGVVAQGTAKVAYVPTLTAPGAISLASDLSATGAINLSFYLTSDFLPTVTQNKGQDVRLGSRQVFDSLGNKQWVIDNVVYIDDPQGTGATSAKGKLPEGTTGFLVVRYGILATTDWATTQKVYVHSVTMGARYPIKTTTDEFGKWAYSQVVAVTGATLEDLAITA